MSIKVATVFGATGFIGRYIVRELAKTGARVVVPSREPDRALHLKPMGDVGQIVPVAANVRDAASVRRAVEGADTVINLCGLLFEKGSQSFQTIHIDAAETIAKAAADAGAARFLQMSALGADEASPSVYAQTKAAGEQAVRAAFPGAVVLRPSLVFGPEDDFFNRFAMYARLSPVLPLIGGGETRFQPVYVGDVADAAVAALSSSDASGKTYSLGGPRTYSFKQLMEIILEEIDRDRLLVPVPFFVARAKGAVIEFALTNRVAGLFSGILPDPPLTLDQMRLLEIDNVVPDSAPGLNDLGIAANALEAILPTYLRHYRRGWQPA